MLYAAEHVFSEASSVYLSNFKDVQLCVYIYVKQSLGIHVSHEVYELDLCVEVALSFLGFCAVCNAHQTCYANEFVAALLVVASVQ